MKIRTEVLIFAEAMEKKLRKNDHKGGWDSESYDYLIARLFEEARELQRTTCRANIRGSYRAVLGEALDVANFAMMIYDNARRELPKHGSNEIVEIEVTAR